jgi:hypothetical protein
LQRPVVASPSGLARPITEAGTSDEGGVGPGKETPDRDRGSGRRGSGGDEV